MQEAHLIARGLIEPSNIEQNTLSREQEETLISEMSTIDQTEIEPATGQGYNDMEKESIAKIIANISLVFWIKTRNELSQIQISPKVDWKVTSQYKDTQGEWQQNIGNGWTGFIPGGAIISKSMPIFGKPARIGERSCITKSNFSTESTMTADKINLSNIKERTISEKCRIGNREISSETEIKGNAQINLPLECSISSENIRCGRIKYLFENEEINQARIRRVSVINIQDQNKKKKPSKQTEYIIGSVIGIAGLIILMTIAIKIQNKHAKKFQISKPKLVIIGRNRNGRDGPI